MQYLFYCLNDNTQKWSLIKECKMLPQLHIEMLFDSMKRNGPKDLLYRVDEEHDKLTKTIMYNPECFKTITMSRLTEPFFRILYNCDKFSVTTQQERDVVKKEINKAIYLINNWCFDFERDFWDLINSIIIKRWKEHTDIIQKNNLSQNNLNWMLYYAMLNSTMLTIYVDTTLYFLAQKDYGYDTQCKKTNEIKKTIDLIVKYSEHGIKTKIVNETEESINQFYNDNPPF